MIGFNSVLLLIFLSMLFGTIILSLWNDMVNLILFRTTESFNKLMFDVYSIFTAGNAQTNRGIDGLLELKNSTLTDIQKQSLTASYSNDIFLGSAMMLILIGFFTLFFRAIGTHGFGGTATLLYYIMFAIIAVGICVWLSSGFQQYPYSGWVRLAMNYGTIGPMITPQGAINATNTTG